jgi:carbon monoxide dehydrogenase subunit G
MDVDRNAAVIAEAEIEVTAPPETVWGVISDIEDWPA